MPLGAYIWALLVYHTHLAQRTVESVRVRYGGTKWT